MGHEPQRVRITGDLYHPVVPAGAARVDRATRWGNPHKVTAELDADEAVGRFRDDLFAGRLHVTVDEVRRLLRGRDLACWCKPDASCHGDVLVAVANELPTGGAGDTRGTDSAIDAAATTATPSL